MSNLAQYMRDALESGQAVYLPEIGTFRKERIPAFFDALKERFVPPFMNLVLTNEQLLENSIIHLIRSETESEKRLRIIEEEIKDLREELRKGDEVILDGLGRLRQNGEHIEFNAAARERREFPDYDEVADIQILREPVIPEPPAPLLAEEEVSVGMVEPTPGKSNRSWLWLIGGLLLAGALFAWFWYRSPDASQGNRLPAAPESTAQGQPAATAGTADTSVLADTTQVREPALAAPDSAAAEPASAAESMIREPSGRFEIIIAAFHTMEEATEFVERTNAKGYDVYIIKNQRPNNLNKVSYASFDTEREADEAVAKVRKEINPDAWIYKNKVNQ